MWTIVDQILWWCGVVGGGYLVALHAIVYIHALPLKFPLVFAFASSYPSLGVGLVIILWQ